MYNTGESHFNLLQRSKGQPTLRANNNNNNIKSVSTPNPSCSTSSSSFSLTEHINSLPVAHQLKGLVDGMTRFFTPAGERKRANLPVYAPVSRKRKDTDKSGATRSAAEESDGAALLSDENYVDGDGRMLCHLILQHTSTFNNILSSRIFCFLPL